MKLYYAPGTISLMPHVALLESGLVAVRVDEASKKMADGEDYNAINPLGYVPALVLDDGSVLIEAAAIAQYIAGCSLDLTIDHRIYKPAKSPPSNWEKPLSHRRKEYSFAG